MAEAKDKTQSSVPFRCDCAVDVQVSPVSTLKPWQALQNCFCVLGVSMTASKKPECF